jgi:hypothetical protein
MNKKEATNDHPNRHRVFPGLEGHEPMGAVQSRTGSIMGVADVSLWRAWSAGLVARQRPQQEQLGRMMIALARELKLAPKDWLSQPHKAFRLPVRPEGDYSDIVQVADGPPIWDTSADTTWTQ